jgi:putative methyltransferase (TIGR04325 family)
MWLRADALNSAPAINLDSNFNVWEGVYGCFAEAPAAGPGFDGPIWRDRSIQAAHEDVARAKAQRVLDYSVRQRNAILPTLTAAMLSEQARVNILDFGGGAGTGYIVLAKAMPDTIDRIDYTVVEVENICQAGRELFAAKSGPTFRTEPPGSRHFDIVHAASVIEQLADYGARFLSLADIFIGEFKPYVTLQNYYSSRIRHWFFNASEFIGEVETNGYKLVLRAECDARILGRYGPLPMENFPPALRIANTSNLLFYREIAR